MAAKSAIIARVALNLVSIPLLKAVYAPAATGLVKEIPNDISVAMPCAMFLANDSPVIPGSWQRETWTLGGSIWSPESPRGQSYRQLVDIADAVLLALQQPDVTAVDIAVQSVILTGFSAIEGRQWNRGETSPWYLVLPFSVDVKVNRPATYGPA